MARAAFEERPRQPARSGADLDNRDGVERSGGARDAAGQVEVENKILTEPLARAELVARDDLAQRRQIGRPVAGRRGNAQAADARWAARRVAMSPASLRAAIKLVGLAAPLPAMSKAVP